MGTKVLFEDASFAINRNEHVGVIGPNGAGKTTLFRILAEDDSLDGGQIVRMRGLRLGYLRQDSDWNLETSVEAFVMKSTTEPLWRMRALGRGLGLNDEHFSQELKTLSGGFRMRAQLLNLLGQHPDLLLLDEPTNYLDLESLLALEAFLQDYAGAFLLISHDREFLRRTTEATLEIESGMVTKFPGTIDDYFEQKAQLAAILEGQIASLEAKRKRVEDFVSRFGAKATKARQAQSRMKQLNKMQPIEKRAVPLRARMILPEPEKTPRQVLSLKNANLGYGDKLVLKNVSQSLERGSHFGIVGPNGAGKSTFLKALAGVLPLKSGQLQIGTDVRIGLYSQHSAEQLDLNHSVMQALESKAHRDCDRQMILQMAGSLLFSGSDTEKKVAVLSGGEKARVALGQLLLSRAPVLLLDEPTNHLDFDTVATLTEALRRFAGTLIVVSHDRSFISQVAAQILEIKHGQLVHYPGTYDEYVWSVARGSLQQASLHDSARSEETTPGAGSNLSMPPDAPSSSQPKINRKSLQAELKVEERQIRDAEKLLTKLESELSEINEKLTANLQNSAIEAKQLSIQAGDVGQRLVVAEETLLAAMARAEQIQNQLKQNSD